MPGDIGSNKEGFVEIMPHSNGDGKHKYHAWRWSRNKITNESYNLIVLPKGKHDYEVYTRVRDFNNTLLKDLITNISNGDSELQSILRSKKFDYPKSVDLIKLLIGSIAFEPSIILDFFAGSGTALHATMQLNAEDGGHRQCILVTNNENNICEEVTYERNKRVINGYTKPNGDFVEGLHDNNLRYYKTEFVSREKSSANRKALMSMTTDLLCIKENLYDEVPFEIDGKKMKPQFVRCFESDDKTVIIIYDPRAVDVIARSLPEKDVRQRLIYVYSDGQYAYNDEFKGKDVELCALPDAIYQALNRVMPRQKEVKL